MSLLQETKNDSILTLTLNRPEKRNALNGPLIDQLLSRLEMAATEHGVRVLILTGAGDNAFCAGADLGGEVGGQDTARYGELLRALIQFPKPTIARINGFCLAGGMGLMLACDITIAHTAAQFGTPEVKVGLWPMMIGALIYRNMLPKQAAPMVLLGERFEARRAWEMGFLSQVVPPAELDDVVTAVAQKLAQNSPLSMKIGKEAFYSMQGLALEPALDYLQQKLNELATTADAQEGIQAFLEKRPPHFSGH
jgi:enoyl-CoA hydratase/carnithine racemase